MHARLLLLLGLTGCINHWQPQEGPPALIVNRSSAPQFRVMRKDGSRVTVEHGRVEGDSLIGSLEPGGAWPAPASRVAIPLSDIQSIDEKEPDIVASVALGALVTLTLLAVLTRLVDQ